MPSNNVNNAIYTNPSSGQSFTNKDFNSIYSEELDLVKDMSPRWDPTISNESDPGVVLLKENAIIADKENYNIDKNVLEVFPLSVSQRGNAEQLYDSLGYGMQWYKAASTTIKCKYLGNDVDFSDSSSVIKIPMFTMVSDDSGEYVYTLVKDVTIDGRNSPVTAPALQGVIETMTINGSDTITLNYLDTNFRLYLQDAMVAENGIYISTVSQYGASEEYWTPVQNLESSLPGTKVYMFGVLPNSNICYIQFPQDIPELIENGLKIKYIITTGEAGNIPENTITKFYEDISIKTSDGQDKVINDDLVVTNPLSATDGKDPESLEDAYKNYKKTVGTFNTLVTCRDYENAIYLSSDEYGRHLVSNDVVSDRTNDINKTWYLTTSVPGKTTRRLAEYTQDTDPLTPFNLCLYLLGSSTDASSKDTYASSFAIASDVTYSQVEDKIAQNKSIQHDYVNTKSDSKPFIIKNFFPVNGSLITYSKVTEQAAKEIEENVAKALYKNFNARAEDFGEPVVYDRLLEVINNADPRIKSVILEDPQYTACVMLSDAADGTINSTSKWDSASNLGTASSVEQETVTKLIAGGNTQLFNFDDRFVYKFGQEINNVISKVSHLETGFTISREDIYDSWYKVRENEAVILSHPSLIAKTVYSANVSYTVNSGAIPVGKYYDLSAPESATLQLHYTKDGVRQNPYVSGIVFIKKEGDDSISGEGWLSSSESITTYDINKTDINGNTPCFWHRNNSENILFAEGSSEIVLGQGEYFLYSNTDLTDLVYLGQGTKLSLSDPAISDIKMRADLSSIPDNTSEMQNVDWVYWNEISSSTLTITEMTQLILGTDCEIKAQVERSVDGDPQSASDIEAKDENGETVDVEKFDGTMSSYSWMIQTNLNINSTIASPQKIDSSQTVKVYYVDGGDTPVEIPQGAYISFNADIVMAGGDYVDLSALDSGGNVIYPVEMISYAFTPPDDTTTTSYDWYEIDGSDITSLTEFTISFASSMINNTNQGKSVVALYVTMDDAEGEREQLNVVSGTAVDSNSPVMISQSGMYYFRPIISTEGSTTTMTFSLYGGQDFTGSIQISPVSITGKVGDDSVPYYNQEIVPEGLSSVDTYIRDVIDNLSNIKIASPITGGRASYYDYTYRANQDTIHHIENPLSSSAFWDVNHPYNRFTIAQIESCNVKVISSSKI